MKIPSHQLHFPVGGKTHLKYVFFADGGYFKDCSNGADVSSRGLSGLQLSVAAFHFSAARLYNYNFFVFLYIKLSFII